MISPLRTREIWGSGDIQIGRGERERSSGFAAADDRDLLDWAM